MDIFEQKNAADERRPECDVLYSSQTLRVFTSAWKKTDRRLLAVCFQYRLEHQRLDRVGFASEFLAQVGIPAVFVNCASNEWYQYTDLPVALQAVSDFARPWERVFTFGSSMGGYAAIRFAAKVGAHSCISIGPQYSPRSSRVPDDTRYDHDVRDTCFLFEDSLKASSGTNNYLAYDPILRLDRAHALKYQKDALINLIPVPFGGHTPTVAIGECGLLESFIRDLANGCFDLLKFRVEFRKARYRSPHYCAELHNYINTRWPQNSTSAAFRASASLKDNGAAESLGFHVDTDETFTRKSVCY
jgi:pimeloyl-ACP methyl ester carboxylesterase